jgi:hypothetical protein
MLNLSDELKRFKQLRADLETVEGMDETCLMDTLEGATDLKETLLAIDDEIQEREHFAVALAGRIEQMQKRLARHKKMIETLRTIILRAMDSAGLPKIEDASVTISIKKTTRAAEIIRESDIPARFWVKQDPKLDKAMLAAALTEGPVPGAVLGNGGINLQIRRS